MIMDSQKFFRVDLRNMLFESLCQGGSGDGGGGSAEAAAAVRLDSESGGRDKDGGVPAWMKNLGSMVAGWLAKLPKK